MTEQELQEKKDRFDKAMRPLIEKQKQEKAFKEQKKLLTRRAIEHHQEEARLRDMLEIDFE